MNNETFYHQGVLLSWNYKVKVFFAGINIFLDGFVPTENLRFRESSFVETAVEDEIRRMARYEYPAMKKELGMCICHM